MFFVRSLDSLSGYHRYLSIFSTIKGCFPCPLWVSIKSLWVNLSYLISCHLKSSLCSLHIVASLDFISVNLSHLSILTTIKGSAPCPLWGSSNLFGWISVIYPFVHNKSPLLLANCEVARFSFGLSQIFINFFHNKRLPCPLWVSFKSLWKF